VHAESTAPLPGNAKLIAGLLDSSWPVPLAGAANPTCKTERENREMIETQAKMLAMCKHQ